MVSANERIAPDFFAQVEDAEGNATFTPVGVKAVEPQGGTSGIGGAGLAALFGGKFCHADLGDALIEERHACFIDGMLAVWDNGRYLMGEDPAEAVMVDYMRGITTHQRHEVLSYLRLKAPRVQMGDARYIAFENGVLDLETMEMTDNSPELRIPNVIPHRWNPQARCEVLDSALDAWACGNAARRANILEVAGLCCYRGRGNRVMAALTGDGHNGKSTFVNFLEEAIGRDNRCDLDLKGIGRRFQSTQLVGKLADLADDTSSSKLTADELAIVRAVVTGDEVPAEYKFGASFSFRPYATIVFVCNEMPKFEETTSALFSRLHPIPFEATFKPGCAGFDPKLPAKLKTEEAYERLLFLSVSALRGFLDRGELTESGDREKALHQLRKNDSSVYEFACEVLDLESPDGMCPVDRRTQEVYDRYKSWCDDVGRKPVSCNKFTADLCEAMGLKSERKRHYVNGEVRQAATFVRQR